MRSLQGAWHSPHQQLALKGLSCEAWAALHFVDLATACNRLLPRQGLAGTYEQDWGSGCGWHVTAKPGPTGPPHSPETTRQRRCKRAELEIAQYPYVLTRIVEKLHGNW